MKEGSNLNEGIPRLTQLIRRYHPTQPGYYSDLAEALDTAGDRAQSEQYFNEALRRAPNSTVLMLKFANAQIEWQQFAKAEPILRRAVALAPRDPVAWGLLGQSLFQQGKGAEAKPALTKALALDPDLAEPHNYLAAMLVRQGDLDGAKRNSAPPCASFPEMSIGRLILPACWRPVDRFRKLATSSNAL